MIPIDIQVSRSKVKLILYMLGEGGISVLQTSILYMCVPCDKTFLSVPKKLDLVTLTFDLLLKKPNLRRNFLTIRDGVFSAPALKCRKAIVIPRRPRQRPCVFRVCLIFA